MKIKKLWLYIALISIFFLVFIFLRKNSSTTVRSSILMTPTLVSGQDYKVVPKPELDRFDIIVFTSKLNDEEQQTLRISRLIGFEGETVKIMTNSTESQLNIDGKMYDEPYVINALEFNSDEIKVEPEKVFVMVDYRNSLPPIYYQIPKEDILGVIKK